MFQDKRKVVTYLWITTQVDVFCFIICCWAAAGDMKKWFNNYAPQYGTTAIDPVLFDVVWSSFVVGVASIFSGLVLFRPRYKTVLNYGIMVGMGLITMHIGLSLTARFANSTYSYNTSYSSYKALAFFSIMYFLFEIALSIMLLAYKNELLMDVKDSSDREGSTHGDDGRDTSHIIGNQYHDNSMGNAQGSGTLSAPLTTEDNIKTESLSDNPR